MKLSSITIFLKVADHGSVRKAADDANITASAVSRHVAALETMIGARLFDRRPPGMVLTEEGEVLERHARPIARGLDVVSAAVKEIKNSRRGVIRIIAIEAVATSLVHPAIREFRALHPDVSFEMEVITKDNAEVAHAILGGTADIGLMYKLNINSDLDYVTEFRSPFAVIAVPDHPIAQRTEISMANLADVPVAALAPSSATRKLIDEVVRAGKSEPKYALTVNSFEMAKQFVMTGNGVCLLPACAVERERLAGKLVALPLTDYSLRSIKTAVCVKRERTLPPTVKRFLDTLVAAAENWEAASRKRP